MDNVIASAVGTGHSMALTSEGNLFAWGRNFEGQVGSGTVDGAPYPHRAPYPINIKAGVSAIASGANNSAAITTNGSLYVWGMGHSGQIGNGYFINQHTPVKIMDNVAQVSISGGVFNVHILALTTDGDLWGWGCNQFGQLGISPDVLDRSSEPILIRSGA